MLKLYGVPLSQPFRSVAWTLLQHRVPFEIVLTVPGMNTKVGTRHESFLSKSRGRTGTVPLLEDGPLTISESPAILAHLCEKHGWTNWYGEPGSTRKAVIDSYMHWHHSGARRLAVLQVAAIRPDLKYTPTEKDMDQVHQVLESLEQGWLCHDPFLAGTAVSIADMLAYEEFAQVYMTGLFPQVAEYAKIAAWMQRMTELPFHDEVHHALAELGSLAEPNETPLNKRLSAATKSALAVFKKAQDDFVVSKL